MAKARARVSESAKYLLRSDWEVIIQQAALGVEDTKIATMYLLDAIPQVDIGVEIGLERSTVSRRLSKILPKVERAGRKLNLL